MIKFYFNCLLTNTAYSVHFYLDNVNIIAGIDEGFKKLTAFWIGGTNSKYNSFSGITVGSSTYNV